MYRISVCFFLLLNARVNCLMTLADIGDVISFTHEVVIDVLKTWHVVSPMIEGPNHIDLPLLKDREKRLISKISEVTRRVDRVDKVLQGVATATMLNLQEDIPTQIRTEMRLDALLQLVTMIHTADNAFQEYLNLISGENSTEPQLEQHTLQNFASYVVSHNPDSVQGILDRIHYMISPDSKLTTAILLNKGLYDLVIQALQETGNKLCHVQQSPHQVLFNLYNSLQLTQLKGYTMMQFSWMLLRLYKLGEFSVESRLMRERYVDRMIEQVQSIKSALKSADQSYWKCDPKHHVEGETYEQFTRLLQGYIQNEVDLNSEQSCSENCGYYSVTKQYGCFQNQFCSKQRSCNGDIVDCQFIDADMWVCQADPRKSSRRYDWIAYENGRVLGNKGNCYRQNKVDSWWRWLFWHCSYCFCICDDPAFSDRYINLRSVLSNISDNKVVVGIRFVKNNGIMHLQIQEAQMLPFASVNQSSIQWRPVDQYKTTTEGVIEGLDYVTLSYKKRGIDLDDLKAPEGYVLIGVKFRVVGSHVNLEVLATPFNFTTGQLDQPGTKSIWISNDNTDASLESPRTQVVLESPENPLHSLSPSKIDSKHDQYLLFTHSDVDLDAAQTTVPFFDAQIVAPQPATLLNGIGIYHKGNRWFGGFIGVKVFTLDYSVYLQDTFPTVNETEYITKG